MTLLDAELGRAALALQKRGERHDEETEKNFWNVSGYLMVGVMAVNPTYAARPDNSGLALLRYAFHGDLDLFRRWLTLSLDLNMFSDRQSPSKARPSELDTIVGIGTKGEPVPGLGVEGSLHFENDATIDGRDTVQPGYVQRYVDVYGRLTLDAAALSPPMGEIFPRQNATLSVTLGIFVYNPSYAARPDNSGLALFRYGLHTDIDLYKPYLQLRFDANLFTDQKSSKVAPTELDAVAELAWKLLCGFELRLVVEQDMPLDRGTLVQTYFGINAFWNFDVKKLLARRKGGP